jgi:hypothetical protein
MNERSERIKQVCQRRAIVSKYVFFTEYIKVKISSSA